MYSLRKCFVEQKGMISYKIAFYIQLLNSKKVLQNTNIDLGNPGVGGTQYLFLLTVKYLNRLYGSNYAILITDGKIGLNDFEIPLLLEMI